MILIALGSNLSSPAGTSGETLTAALKVMRADGIAPLKVSPFVMSEAWPDPNAPPFVNAVASVQTAFSPRELLDRLHVIEQSFGRVRRTPNAPRTLDLDLLDYEGRVVRGCLELPHPRLHERPFVLVPLSMIAPDWHHPISGAPVEELIAQLPAKGTGVRILAASQP